MSWRSVVLSMLSVAWLTYPAMSQQSIFTITRSGVELSLDPAVNVKLGQRVDLGTLKRIFRNSNVKKEYDVEASRPFFQISFKDKKISIRTSDSDRIEEISSYSHGVVFAGGGVIGGSARAAVGSKAYCNTHTEDRNPYCKRGSEGNVEFDIESKDDCKLPEFRSGIMMIPECAKVLSIYVYGDR